MKVFGALLIVMGMLGVAFAADTMPATSTKPATSTASPPATPACCGDKCKPMPGCCKADASGKVTCAMGGGCCQK